MTCLVSLPEGIEIVQPGSTTENVIIEFPLTPIGLFNGKDVTLDIREGTKVVGSITDIVRLNTAPIVPLSLSGNLFLVFFDL